MSQFKLVLALVTISLFSTQFLAAQTTCTISSGTVTASNLNSTCPSGFTKLVVTGSSSKLEIDNDYTNNNLIELSIEGSAVLEWTANKAFTMAATGNLYLNKNGGGTIPNSSPCNTNQDLFMGNVEVANCPGSTGVSSFAQVNAAGGVNATGALPVDLLFFNAKEQDDNILIEWSTASELNSDIYELYYSEDDNEYIKFNEVLAAGNSNSILNYAVTLPKGNQTKLYFKLKQIDIDGEFEEYKTILKISSVKPLMVFPNPFRNELKIRLSADELQSPKFVQLVNLEGVTIASDYLYQSTNELSFDTQSLRAGIYLLVVDGITHTKVLKQ